MQAAEMESRNSLADRAADALTQTLSDENVLLLKLRNYHWNVAGPHFRQLHALFEEQYGILAIRIDQVAERIQSLGISCNGYHDRVSSAKHAS